MWSRFILQVIPMEFFFTRKSFVKISWQKFLWSCSKFAQMNFRINKFAKFWKISDCFWKFGKKIAPSLTFGHNFKLEIGFFSSFSKKVPNIPKFGKFFYSEIHLSKYWAMSEKLLSRDFYKGFPYKKKSMGITYKMNLDQF